MSVPHCITIVDGLDDDDDVMLLDAAVQYDSAAFLEDVTKKSDRLCSQTTPVKSLVDGLDDDDDVVLLDAAVQYDSAAFLEDVTKKIDRLCNQTTPVKSLEVLNTLKRKVEESIDSISPKKPCFSFKRPVLCTLPSKSPTPVASSSSSPVLCTLSSKSPTPVASSSSPVLCTVPSKPSSPEASSSSSSPSLPVTSTSPAVLSSSSSFSFPPTHQASSSASLTSFTSLNEFAGHGYAHSNQLLETFHDNFKFTTFRPQQLEAMNAILLNHDCLINMPTGGGKSLCFQIPAAVSKGVTVVVSPLISLMYDQAQKMKTVGIKCGCLHGDVPKMDRIAVYSDLSNHAPSIKLLYVTPESLVKNDRLNKSLRELYSRGRVSRFVIDEAHCVEDWGKDFRCDYSNLKYLRRSYQQVPIVALTATATATTMIDLVHRLGMKNVKIFKSGLNRENLQYMVCPKKPTVMDEIVEIILSEFPGQSGIIYCFSRKECETTAAKLSLCGVKSLPYHAGLSAQVRQTAQTAWMDNEVQVIAATIAFGMGVDKQDVRFVIHLTMSKSIQGYYQETGRAGRDGKEAKCITFYSFKDSTRISSLIQSNAGNAQNAEKELNNVNEMVEFLQEKVQCRRVMLQTHFTDESSSAKCKDSDIKCDNCQCIVPQVNMDITEEAAQLLQNIGHLIDHSHCTINYVVNVLRGSRLKKIVDAGHTTQKVHGLFKNWKKADVEKLLQTLILQSYLSTVSVATFMNVKNVYLKSGPKVPGDDFKMVIPVIDEEL